MKTYYIPVHYHGQDEENDDLVVLITQNEIDKYELQDKLENIKNYHMDRANEYPSSLEITDAVFNKLASEINGVWCYCETLPQLVIGVPEGYADE
jgi:hypothetical protein